MDRSGVQALGVHGQPKDPLTRMTSDPPSWIPPPGPWTSPLPTPGYSVVTICRSMLRVQPTEMTDNSTRLMSVRGYKQWHIEGGGGNGVLSTLDLTAKRVVPPPEQMKI